MRRILSLKRHHYLQRVGIFLIAVALIVGTVSCDGTAPLKYDLTMAENPAGGGTATDLTGASPYAKDTDVNIKAVANPGYQFVSWSAPAGTFTNENEAETKFTMPAQDVTVTANFVAVTLDHAKCYFADGVEPIDKVVYLEDQFGAVNATVGWAWGFCNPVMKWHDEELTPISNPDHHLTIYDIGYEKEPQTWFVEVHNQFGTQNLTVSGPFGLAVPTQKVVPGQHEPPVGLDHYLLYYVEEGLSVDVGVSLQDQFHDEPEEAMVYEPMYFANPVRKTHGDNVTEIMNPEVHAVIYRISCEGFGGEVQVVNQFGEQAFDVYTFFGNAALAVPSEKIDWEPAPPAVVAVLGDYDSQLTNLLIDNNIWAEERGWDVISDIGDYYAVVVNCPSDPGETTFLDFLDAASGNQTGVVFTSSYDTISSWGISLLEWYLGDPAGQSEDYENGDVSYNVTQNHAIFDGWNVDDEITIITGGVYNDHAWFWDYSGDTIADVGSDSGGIQGDAVAVGTYGGSTHVLLASLGPQGDTDMTDWTNDAKTIFINAVCFAGGI